MLADAAAALFGAGLGAPENVQPFMEIYIYGGNEFDTMGSKMDSGWDEEERGGSHLYTFMPACRVTPPACPEAARGATEAILSRTLVLP